MLNGYNCTNTGINIKLRKPGNIYIKGGLLFSGENEIVVLAYSGRTFRDRQVGLCLNTLSSFSLRYGDQIRGSKTAKFFISSETQNFDAKL